MAKRRRLTTIDEAVPATHQHTKPCSDCPWARASIPGWLGGVSDDQWLREAHGEARIDCHTLIGAHCAGSAIYRGNCLKRPRPGAVMLVLPPDRERVFSNPTEFLTHHRAGPGG